MVSFSVGLLDNFAIIDGGHEHENLQYFLHDLNHNCILGLDNFGHVFIKLNLFIAIAFDNEVLAHEGTHIAYYSIAKLIVLILGLVNCAIGSFNGGTGYLS